ncbi:MAG: GtrA family protein [Spirochaetales bacterium]|nr:GtrA family protein [Spirochaetales bacterium]
MNRTIKKLFFEKNNDIRSNLFRSIIASAVSFLLDFVILICLVEIFNIYYLIAGATGFITGTTFLYFLSITWIFQTRNVNNKIYEFMIFILLGFIGGSLNTLFLWLLTDKIEMFYMLSRIAAATLIFFFNFTARKIILFTKTNN